MVAIQHDFSDIPTRVAAALVVTNHMQSYFKRSDVVDRLREQHDHNVSSEQQVKRALHDLRRGGYVEKDGHYYRIVR